MNNPPLLLLASCGDYVKVGGADNPMALDRAATPETIAFEAVVLLGVLAACAVMYRRVPRFALHFLATAAGVLIFEFFTAPMWRNQHLGAWGYVYHDVSWILTVGWTTLILCTVALVDRLAPKWGEGLRFLVSLGLLLPLVVLAENVVVGLGIRSYAPEVTEVLSGYQIGLVPVEVLYYVPVFTALVIAFSKYWGFVIDNAALVPVRRQRWLRALGLTFLAVFLFEVMIEPMVRNENLPAWSYVYHDVNFLLTGLWVAIIAVAGLLVQRYLQFRPIPQRFAAALAIITIIALPVESWLIHNGYRVYGESAKSNFCGYDTWLTGVPVEVVFAIPLYMALVVGFVRYWEIVGENGL
jgi:hypothetical protein